MKKVILMILFISSLLFLFTSNVFAFEEITGNAKVLGYSYNFVKSEYFNKNEIKAEVAIIDRDFLANIKHMRGISHSGDYYQASGSKIEEFRKDFSTNLNNKLNLDGKYELFSASMNNAFNSNIIRNSESYASSFYKQYSSLNIKERYFLPDFKSM